MNRQVTTKYHLGYSQSLSSLRLSPTTYTYTHTHTHTLSLSLSLNSQPYTAPLHPLRTKHGAVDAVRGSDMQQQTRVGEDVHIALGK